MCVRRKNRWLTSLLLTSCLAGPAFAADEPVLRLSGVPDQLVLPLPDGSNRILTATISGATPQSVWLAANKEAKLQVQLSRVGKGEFQVNLGDPAVAAVAKATTTVRQLHVFARLKDAKILTSVPISYKARTKSTTTAPSKCYVYITDRKDRVELACPGQHAVNSKTVRRIEFPIPADAKNAVPPRAEFYNPLDAPRQQLKRGDGVWYLDVTAEIREAWLKGGTMYFRGASTGGFGYIVLLRDRPDELEFPGNVSTVEIQQRRSKSVPGSRNYLTISIGDITAGQTMLTLRDNEGKEPIHMASVRQGDTILFDFRKNQYVLHVRKLVNLLIGDDWAVVDVSTVPDKTLKSIEQLLQHIESVPVKFVREGKEYTGRETVRHLRQKLAAAGPRIKTVSQFIQQIASRSSGTGNPYLVRLADGTTVEAKQWLTTVVTTLNEETRPSSKSNTDAKKQS